ncbi:MAG: hypothetical protein WBG54_03850 [Acidobacteriaceae bacterium]
MLLRSAVLSLLLTMGVGSVSAGVKHRTRTSTVMPCPGVTLTASYLAEATPGAGPGFLFRIDNRTAHAIRLERPVPSSAHWYAEVGNRWLWRSSAGRGGALVDAERPKGAMFAYRPATTPRDPQYLTVPAHGSQQWAEAMGEHPAIAYDPSCPMCNYPGESQYQAVFAYAYLPGAGEDEADLLRCGLRSAPVPMPPHPAGK